MKKLALLLVLMLVTAGCGGGGEESLSDSNPPSTSPATTAPAGDDHDDDQEADTASETAADHADDDHAEDDHATEGDHAGDGEAGEEATDDHSDDDHDQETAGADRTVQVAMNEFSFEPAEFEAMAGETVEFVVTNLGVVEHEFRLSNEHRIDEHLASGHADHDEGSGHHEDGDVVLLVEPGGTGSVTVTFGDDTTLFTEVACLIPGHYEAGMKAPMRHSA